MKIRNPNLSFLIHNEIIRDTFPLWILEPSKSSFCSVCALVGWLQGRGGEVSPTHSPNGAVFAPKDRRIKYTVSIEGDTAVHRSHCCPAAHAVRPDQLVLSSSLCPIA